MCERVCGDVCVCAVCARRGASALDRASEREMRVASDSEGVARPLLIVLVAPPSRTGQSGAGARRVAAWPPPAARQYV